MVASSNSTVSETQVQVASSNSTVSLAETQVQETGGLSKEPTGNNEVSGLVQMAVSVLYQLGWRLADGQLEAIHEAQNSLLSQLAEHWQD